MDVNPRRRIDLHCRHLVLPYGKPEHAHLDDGLIRRPPRPDGLHGGGARQSLSRQNQRQLRAPGARVSNHAQAQPVIRRFTRL